MAEGQAALLDSTLLYSLHGRKENYNKDFGWEGREARVRRLNAEYNKYGGIQCTTTHNAMSGRTSPSRLSTATEKTSENISIYGLVKINKNPPASNISLRKKEEVSENIILYRVSIDANANSRHINTTHTHFHSDMAGRRTIGGAVNLIMKETKKVRFKNREELEKVV